MTEPRHPIEVGTSYACVQGDQRLAHPVRAEVIEQPDGDMVRVRLHHPDVDAVEKTVSIHCLDTPWDQPPSSHFWGIQAPSDPWQVIAARSYAAIRRQRALAQRLSAFGINRALAHYAGQGGTSDKHPGVFDTRLILTNDEIEALVAMAEELRDLRQRA